MYIQWINHPQFPEKNGIKEHVANAFGECAIGYGQAVLAARPNYGTPEFLAERAEMQKNRGTSPHDTPAPFVNGLVWDIVSNRLGQPCVRFRRGSEAGISNHGEIPPECPAHIAEQYEKLIEQERAIAAARKKMP